MKKTLFLFAVLGCICMEKQLNAQSYTWKTFVKPSTYLNITDFRFYNNGFGWYLETSSYVQNLYFTDDGGKNWTKQTLPTTGDAMDAITQVYFFDKNTGFVRFMNTNKNKAKLYTTSNGGGQWTMLTDTTFARYKNSLNQPGPFYNLNFLNTGFFYGYQQVLYNNVAYPFVYVSRDGGKTFEDISTSIDTMCKAVYDLKFADEKTGYATIEAKGTGYNREIIKTSDGGKTWTLVKGDTYWMYKIAAVDSANIYVEDDWSGTTGGILATSNGGATWNNLNIQKKQFYNYWGTTPQSITISTMDNMTFLNKNYGIISYTSLTSVRAYIHTLDGGQTWIQDTVSKSVPGYTSPDLSLEKIQILGVDNAYAIVKGVLVSTSSGGIFTSAETERNSSADIIVFPNPVTENASLHIELPYVQSFSVKIYNILGKTVYESPEIISNQMILNTGDLYSGVYFLQIQGEKERIAKKIIVR